MDRVNTLKKGACKVMAATAEALFAQRHRWFLWLPVPVALGISWFFALAQDPPRWAGASAVGLTLLLALFLWRRAQPGAALLTLPVLFFALGFFAAQVRTAVMETDMLAREAGPLTIEATVTGIDVLPKGLRLTLSQVKHLDGRLPRRVEKLPDTVRLRLQARDPLRPRIGDLVQVRTVLLPLSAPVMPGGFDFQRHAYFQGYGATGYAIGPAVTVPLDEKQNSKKMLTSYNAFFTGLRQAIVTRLDAAMADRQNAAVTAAMLVGEMHFVSPENWKMIRESGIAHLLTISGFHITILTGVFFFGFRALLAAWPWAALHWPIKKISAVTALAASVFYLQLIGAPIPAQRAVLTAAVVMTAVLLDRDPFSLRLAAFVGLVLILAQPEILIGPSFQMSFAAVVALIAVYEGAGRRLLEPKEGWLATTPGRLWVYFLASIVTTLVSTVATAPFTIYHFGQVPLLAGIVSNLIAVPLSSFIILPVGVLACALLPFGLETTPLWIVEKAVVLVMATVRLVTAWPDTLTYINSFPAMCLGLMTLGGLWICIWQAWWRWLGLVPVAIAVVMAALAPRPVVLLAENGRLMAVVDPERAGWWYLSHTRREGFVAETWLRREGAPAKAQPAGNWKDAEEKGILRCDAAGCLYRPRENIVISLARTLDAVKEDCGRADVIVSAAWRVPRDACQERGRKTTRIIDRYDLLYRGAHALYVAPPRNSGDGQEVIIRRAADARGFRPWVVR